MQEHHNVLPYDSVLGILFQNPHLSNHRGFMLSVEVVIAFFCARTNAPFPNSLVLMTVLLFGSALRIGTAILPLFTLSFFLYFLSSEEWCPFKKSGRVNVAFALCFFLHSAYFPSSFPEDSQRPVTVLLGH